MLVGAGPAGLAWEGLGRPSLGPGCGLVLDEVGEALGRQGWLSELRIDWTGDLVEAATRRGTMACRASLGQGRREWGLCTGVCRVCVRLGNWF